VSWPRRLDTWWLAPAPAERVATLRALCGAFAVVYLVARASVLADFRSFAARDFAPVGLANLLSSPLPASAVTLLYLATLTSGVAFTLGLRYRVSGPLFALSFLALTSYRNSWGMVFHTDNLLALHLGVLALAPAADALSLDARRLARPAAADDPRYGWPVRLLCTLTTLSYLLAGIAKLKLSGVAWMHGEILRNYIAYDAVRKAQVGSVYSPLGGVLVQYAWPFPIIGALTMLLELAGPLLLWHAKLARLWALGIYAFHVGVLATMAIAFPYPLSFVAFASFFECERWRVVKKALGARTPGAAALAQPPDCV
jgi:Vitamin K-dependent gamma-carboxylase